MVKIRLRRIGAKKAPFYRIVVADSRFARDGRFIEEIGYYDPTKEPSVVKIDADKAKQWLGQRRSGYRYCSCSAEEREHPVIKRRNATCRNC